MQVNNTQLGITANLEPLPDLKVDLIADRQNAENYARNFRVKSLLEQVSMSMKNW